MLLHELQHIRHRDPWLNLFALLALAVNFYNPLVWMLVRQLKLYMAMDCDDITRNHEHMEGKSFSRHLLDLASRSSQSTLPVSALAFSESRQLLKKRIMYQLNRKEQLMAKWLRVFIITLLALAILPFTFSLAAQSKVHSINSVDVKPVLKTFVQPVYPESARKANIQGKVVLRLIVNKQGNVSEATVIESIPELDDAALAVAKKTTFSPAEKNGKKVKVELKMPFQFRLK